LRAESLRKWRQVESEFGEERPGPATPLDSSLKCVVPKRGKKVKPREADRT